MTEPKYFEPNQGSVLISITEISPGVNLLRIRAEGDDNINEEIKTTIQLISEFAQHLTNLIGTSDPKVILESVEFSTKSLAASIAILVKYRPDISALDFVFEFFGSIAGKLLEEFAKRGGNVKEAQIAASRSFGPLVSSQWRKENDARRKIIVKAPEKLPVVLDWVVGKPN